MKRPRLSRTRLRVQSDRHDKHVPFVDVCYSHPSSATKASASPHVIALTPFPCVCTTMNWLCPCLARRHKADPERDPLLPRHLPHTSHNPLRDNDDPERRLDNHLLAALAALRAHKLPDTLQLLRILDTCGSTSGPGVNSSAGMPKEAGSGYSELIEVQLARAKADEGMAATVDQVFRL
ncbi:hypothetical protein PLICRDRAFT_692880 [Plicaturopsis crispa FD-325 SS-3]|nr:hypothetical protein PLICRDRAFT_692880 [Plicaturopsis crispa FD-325 SS-3]